MNNPAKVRYKIELTYKLKVQIRLVAVVNSICPKFTYFLKNQCSTEMRFILCKTC